jgi:2,4-dienoyl-CoA reductase-like NADH-dependent reductase (Old Yellow Enzyme family)
MAEYYRQRSSAGLIISEATAISTMGAGCPHTPGIWLPEQIVGWKDVTAAVHAAGGRILLQLWHSGRASDPFYLGGALPVAPSAIALSGPVPRLYPHRPYVVPRALDLEEISRTIDDYRVAAKNAMTAGFDGVEICGANGCLPDQFLHNGSNQRTDRYGGSVENRARLLLEALDAAVEVWGRERVGLHLSPSDQEHEMRDSDPVGIYHYVAREAGRRKIAFIIVRQARSEGWMAPSMKKAFGGICIANDHFTKESGEEAVDSGEVDAVAYGRLFISNPDLPERFARRYPLAEPDLGTFYAHGPRGYTDYPLIDSREDPWKFAKNGNGSHPI